MNKQGGSGTADIGKSLIARNLKSITAFLCMYMCMISMCFIISYFNYLRNVLNILMFEICFITKRIANKNGIVNADNDMIFQIA